MYEALCNRDLRENIAERRCDLNTLCDDTAKNRLTFLRPASPILRELSTATIMRSQSFSRVHAHCLTGDDHLSGAGLVDVSGLVDVASLVLVVGCVVVGFVVVAVTFPVDVLLTK